MTNNKCCGICYNKNTNDIIKCHQCKNKVCDICYANIIYNNENFNDDYMDNKSYFKCAYCNYNNVFSTKINNYNTNDKLIKLLIKENDININDYNFIVKDTNKLIIERNSLAVEVNGMKDTIDDLQNTLTNVKKKKQNIKNKLIESKSQLQQINNYSAIKFEKIITLLNNTKRRTLLFDQINEIINS